MGVAAIAVPIVLHLMAKREPRKVVFPSIHFLTKRFESNRSRLRVRRWWLLALRIAAIAALALALARPAIDRSVSTTWISIGLIVAMGIALLAMASVAVARGQNRSLGLALSAAAVIALLVAVVWGGYAYASGPSIDLDDGAPVAIAIVIDNGPTSAWATADDVRSQRIRDIAKWMVSRLPRTSRIAVVDRSRQPIAFSLDIGSAISKIDQVRPLQVVQPIASRIDNAARLLRTSELSNRQIFVITDLSQSTWTEPSASNALSRTLGESPPIAVNVFDLGEFDGTNRSLSIPEVTDMTPAKGVSVPVSVTLALRDLASNSDATAEPDRSETQVTAELQMYAPDPTLPVIRDGEIRRPQLVNVDRTSVRASPNSSHEIVLSIPPLDVGTHHGQIRLVGTDAMPLDDVRYFSLSVLPPSSVLLVSDNENSAKVMGLTMVAPLTLDDPAAEFVVQRIASSDLPVVQVDDFDAVVLMDPPRTTLRDQSLIQYVNRGGGLLVCLGPAAGEEPLTAPAIIELVRRWRVPSPGTFFQYGQHSHPVVDAMSNIRGGVPWNEYRISQYWQLAADVPTDDTVLMQFAGTEHPAVLQRRFTNPAKETDLSKQGSDSDQNVNEDGGYRAGRCLIVSTPLPDLSPPRDRWNDLYGSDAWPAFVLVRQLTDYVTNRGGEQFLGAAGNPHVYSLVATASPDREPSTDQDVGRSDSRRLQLFAAGQSAPIPINLDAGANQVVIRDVPVAGTYWLRGDQPGAGFSVNMLLDANALTRVDRSRLDQWFGTDGYQLATNRDDVELAESESASRVLLRSPAMLLALIIFLLEQILSNRFYRSRANSSAASLPSGDSASQPRGMGAA